MLWLIVTAPLSRALEPLDDPALLLLSATTATPIARRGAIKEAPVDVAKLNPLTPAAFVAIEDRRFYRHWGIDPRGIGRAMVANMRGGGVRQGGSTITQQLAKTNFLSGDRTIKRKAQEVIIAFWLEAWLTKQEILSRYLSSVYFGDGVYGLRAAAHHYFDRDPENLTLAQSAMLAGMVQAPSRLAPTHNLARRPEAQPAGARRRWPTPASISRGARACDRARRGRSAQASKVPTGTYFADWVAPARADRRSKPTSARSRCATTLDRDLQRLAVRAVGTRRDRRRPGGAGRDAARRARWSRWSAARATRTRRSTAPPRRGASPGSAFKLFVYLAALRAGWTPDSMIEDEPITIDGWTPVNSDGVYRGRDHAARGVRPVEQCRDRAPVAKRSAATTSSAPRATSASPRRCPTSRASRWAPPASACSS